jgi:putative endonuclease
VQYNIQMYYVYLLQSKTLDTHYVGYTSDLKARFESHNAGKNVSTKAGKPWKLVYYEAYQTEIQAMRREKNLKRRGNAYQSLKQRIASSA